jgi:hypothetical protein
LDGTIRLLRKLQRADRAVSRQHDIKRGGQDAEAWAHLERVCSPDALRKCRFELAGFLDDCVADDANSANLSHFLRSLRDPKRPGALGPSGLLALSFCSSWRGRLCAGKFFAIFTKFTAAGGGFEDWTPENLLRVLVRKTVDGRVVSNDTAKKFLRLIGVWLVRQQPFRVHYI